LIQIWNARRALGGSEWWKETVMRTNWIVKVFVVSCLVLAAPMTGRMAVAVEQAEYTIVDAFEEIEIRRYESQILAETAVEGEFAEAGNVAFGRLFGYIRGDNRSRTSIDMTAPVVQETTSEKIAMTAPVTTEGEDGSWRVAFVLPGEFTWDTAPEPTDDLVKLRQVPERTVAAVRFSGRWKHERFLEQEQLLEELLESNGFRRAGDTVYARYDPPFKPAFMRRNEVLIPVERIAAE
jgi:hypothetical protein